MINTDELFDIFDNDDRIVDVREITDGEMYDIICENKKIANQVADMLNSRLGTVAFGFMKTGSGGYYRFTIIPHDYEDVYLNESKKSAKTLKEYKLEFTEDLLKLFDKNQDKFWFSLQELLSLRKNEMSKEFLNNISSALLQR